MANWDIFDAQRLLKHLKEPCRDVGYTLALYGSVLTEMGGDDLDILAVPFRGHTVPSELARVIMQTACSQHLPKQPSTAYPQIQFSHSDCMTGGRVNFVFNVPFTRVFTRGWLHRKLDVVVYPYLWP